jgi:TRAP-type C4-dicarboxylate transport system substrate-binding protein
MIRDLFGVLAAILIALPAAAQIGEQPPGPAFDVAVVANAPPGGPGDKLWRMFEDAVAEKSSGRITLQMLVHGQIGGDDLVMQALRRGRGQIGIVAESGLAQVVPEVSVLNMPYLFDSPAELDFVVDQFVTPAVSELVAHKGLVFQQWIEIGWMNVYGKQALTTPRDADGYRLRALPYETSQAFLKAIGADVINLSFPDVIPGLQTGLIDGGESSTLMYARAGLYQEAPHLTLTRHAYSFGALLANAEWLAGLAPEDRGIMTSSFPDQRFVRKDTRDSLVLELDAVEQEGVTVHRLSSADIRPWAELARATHKDLLAALGGDSQRIYDLVQEGKAAFAEQRGAAAGGN